MSQAALLELQLDARAREAEAWLRAKVKGRFGGIELGDGTWWALLWRTREAPEGGTRLTAVWFPGAEPAEALEKARRWAEEQLAAAARRAA